MSTSAATKTAQASTSESLGAKAFITLLRQQLAVTQTLNQLLEAQAEAIVNNQLTELETLNATIRKQSKAMKLLEQERLSWLEANRFDKTTRLPQLLEQWQQLTEDEYTEQLENLSTTHLALRQQSLLLAHKKERSEQLLQASLDWTNQMIGALAQAQRHDEGNNATYSASGKPF